MTGKEIVAHVKTLGLPAKSYVVFGSCPLAAAGIREANDVDMLVDDKVFELLKSQGWKISIKGPDDTPLVSGVFEAHSNWDFSPYKPTLAHLLKSATTIDGVPFASLQEVRKWKESSGRPKDFIDIALIDEYIVSSSRSTQP